MSTESCSCTALIHTASLTAAGIGAGLAQVPGSDAALLYPLQTGLICLIAQSHGLKISDGAAAALLSGFVATIAGRTLSQWLVGWIPGLGNVINASTAAAMTEAVGWAAHEHFSQAKAASKQ